MNFYVYVIFRQNGVPCYVGKGTGGRWLDHVRAARNPHLRNIYRQANGDLPVIKVRENLTEKEAFSLEIVLIAVIGREKFGGPLVNLTDGGDGVSGWRHTSETRNAISKLHKKLMADPEYKARVTGASKVTRSTLEFAQKRGAISKHLMEDQSIRDRISASKIRFYVENPDFRDFISVATKSAMENPQVKLRVSEAQKKRFEDPAEREKIAKRIRGRKQSSEERAKRATSLRGKKRTPEQRAKMSAWQIGRKMSDEAKAKMSEAAKRRWDREGKDRLIELAKAGASARWSK